MENSSDPLLPRGSDKSSQIYRRSSPNLQDERSENGDSSSSSSAPTPCPSPPSRVNTRQHGQSMFQKILIIAQNTNISTRLYFIIGIGIIMGSISPKDDKIPSTVVRSISSIVGYTYFLCWSFSFYPQIVTNFTSKSTVGLSSDFSVLNVLGFGCYAVYTCFFFFSHEIQEEYQDRFSDQENSVQSNDAAFALHALLLSSVQVSQILLYDQSFSWKSLAFWTRLFILASAIACMLFGGLVATGYNGFQQIDFLYMLSSIKLAITIIKYIPQVILNYERKSTIGWNVYNVLLDFAGGLLSLVQLVMDAVAMDNFSAITGNFVKFGLGFVSILFDIIFIIQHYVLYPNARYTAHREVVNSSEEVI